MSSTKKKPAPIIFGDESMSDVTLVVDNQDFKTNKTFLACRSDVFKAMFFGLFKESKEDRVEIKDVSAHNFRRFLEIIYTGKVSDPLNFLYLLRMDFNVHDSLKDLSILQLPQYFRNFWVVTTELLSIADRFNLTSIVKDYLKSNITLTMRICRNQTCPQCFNYLIFAILNGMNVSKYEKKYQVDHYREWIGYAYEKPFPDIPNNAMKILLQYLG